MIGKIAITRITVVDGLGQITSHKGRVIIKESELEDYRKEIKEKGVDVDHVLFNYEEVEDD